MEDKVDIEKEYYPRKCYRCNRWYKSEIPYWKAKESICLDCQRLAENSPLVISPALQDQLRQQILAKQERERTSN